MTSPTRIMMMATTILLGLAASCSSPERARCRALAAAKERYCDDLVVAIDSARRYYNGRSRGFDRYSIGLYHSTRAVVRIGVYCAPAQEEAIREVGEALVAVNGYLAAYYSLDNAEVAAMGLCDHLITLLSQGTSGDDGCREMVESQREHCHSFVAWLQATRERYAAGWTHTGLLPLGGEEDAVSAYKTARHCVPDRDDEVTGIAWDIMDASRALVDVRFAKQGDPRAAYIAMLDALIALFVEASEPQR